MTKGPPRYRLNKRAQQILDTGLMNRWYGICPGDSVGTRPLSLTRWGRDLVLWRDNGGALHLHDDRCPHRGAPLSIGRNDGDRLTCAYHGLEVLVDGTVAKVPGEPECDLVGRSAVRTYPIEERHGAVFAWLGDGGVTPVAPLRLPERLTSNKFDRFLSYAEWRCPYRFLIDNNMDPMHGVFLHQDSHSMAVGSKEAEFETNETESGFVFQKKGQRDVNFDWSEWYDADFQAVCLEIPYPVTGGPGGNFGIVFHVTPIDEISSACFFWRHRKVSGWQRYVWRFLYKTRLEGRHWHVLEQDRLLTERMAKDADRKEYLYSHDMAVARVRKLMADEAVKQARSISKPR